MNTPAVIIGLALCVLSAVTCYGVSMVASGLFSRSFYRTYSRILISICCVMLLAPALRWLAATSPLMGAIGLSIAQYLAVAILGYGVYRFNRDYIKRVFLQRTTTSYFVFGTLAYATLVALVFLHVAVSGTPSWAGHGHGYITAAHYGPLLVLLAVMVFDTDDRLKSLSGDPRRFSRFTFVGYAISFLGVSVSTVPFVAEAFDRLSSVAVDSPWIQSLSSAEALLIAICLYGWLVWRYESIPPLFLLLLAIIAEYHVLVTQWSLRAFGPESWGLASLPLFAGIAFLDHYFSNWDKRKQRSKDRHGIADDETVNALRFATPLRLVQWCGGSTLRCHFLDPFLRRGHRVKLAWRDVRRLQRVLSVDVVCQTATRTDLSFRWSRGTRRFIGTGSSRWSRLDGRLGRRWTGLGRARLFGRASTSEALLADTLDRHFHGGGGAGSWLCVFTAHFRQ